MKLFFILSTFVVITARISSAAPIEDQVEVISSYNESTENSYRFGYVLSDGQTRDEEGELVQIEDEQVMRVTGSYSFVGDDGKHYEVLYTADENGYHATIKTNGSPRGSHPDPRSL